MPAPALLPSNAPLARHGGQLADAREDRAELLRRLWGGELLLAAAGLGLLLGFGWIDDRSSCADLEQRRDDAGLTARDQALERFVAERCVGEGCQVERLGLHGCRAKLRLRERRRDGHGEVLGTFDTTVGLAYSPSLDRWEIDAVLGEKQILGLPNR